MGSTFSILDLSAWAPDLGPVFRKALDPATPLATHRALAEQATECLEQGALLGDRAADGEAPWRALLVGDGCFLALEDGFALARFDGSNLVSLRLEATGGRRWSIQHTGRGIAAFRLAALGKATASGGPPPAMKIAQFGDRRLRFSRVFLPDGRDTDEPGGAAGQSLALPPEVDPALAGIGTALLRRAVERVAATQEVPGPPPAAPPPPPAGPRPEPPPPAPAPPAPPPPAAAPEAKAPSAQWRLVGVSGPLAGQVIPVPALAVLGRDPAADIPVVNQTVSRRHAEVRPTEVGMVLKDLGSANGTWFERAQLSGPVLLRSGDTFTLGECTFRVERL